MRRPVPVFFRVIPPPVRVGEISAFDVLLQLLDSELLLADDRLDEIANRDDPDQTALFQNRQVAYALVGHDRHALLDALVEARIEDVRGHDLAHLGRGRGAAFEDDLARVVALGDHADDLLAFADDEGTDALGGHELHRVIDRRAGLDRPDVSTLGREYVTDFHATPPADESISTAAYGDCKALCRTDFTPARARHFIAFSRPVD